MTDKQPEALRLADALTKHLGGNTATQAAAELRRLHAEVQEQCRINGMGAERELRLMALNQELLEALNAFLNGYRHKGEELACAALAKAEGETK